MNNTSNENNNMTAAFNLLIFPHFIIPIEHKHCYKLSRMIEKITSNLLVSPV